MIEVTQDAINQMNFILEKNGDAAVRYEFKGGGCGGLLAEWKSEPHHEPEQGEQVWPLAQGVFVIDEFTKEFIDGVLMRKQGNVLMTHMKRMYQELNLYRVGIFILILRPHLLRIVNT